MASVSLMPMSAERYVTWRATSVAGYADENVRAGHWQPAVALQLAEAQFSELLPDGVDTAGNWLWSVVAESGDEVGTVGGAPWRRAGIHL